MDDEADSMVAFKRKFDSIHACKDKIYRTLEAEPGMETNSKIHYDKLKRFIPSCSSLSFTTLSMITAAMSYLNPR